MIDYGPSAAVAALFIGLAIGALANLFSSRYRVYGMLALACALKGAAYAARAYYIVEDDASLVSAWWALTAAGLGFAIAANATVLASWYRNARSTSKPSDPKPWVRAAQAMVITSAVFGPVMGVAAAGLARGGRTAEAVQHAWGVKQASAWGLLAVAAAVTVQSIGAFVGCLAGFATPPRAPAACAAGSSRGGAAQAGIVAPDPERGSAQPVDLGDPISIIATAIQEDEAEGGDGAAAPPGPAPAALAAAPSAQAVAAPAACPLCRCFAVWCPVRACGAHTAAAAGAAVGAAPAAAAAGRGPEPLVGLLAACGALLVMAAAVRAAAVYDGRLWTDDKLLLLLQALPELLSALVLAVPPHLLARVGMASRYARWQPRKGKPATSRPRNSNPAIWKRAGLPAPESRTQTTSEGA